MVTYLSVWRSEAEIHGRGSEAASRRIEDAGGYRPLPAISCTQTKHTSKTRARKKEYHKATATADWGDCSPTITNI